MSQPSAVSQAVLDELVQRIVEASASPPHHPVWIGREGPDGSAQRSRRVGHQPDGVHRRRTAQTIYRSLWGLGMAKDIVVVTESDVREHSDNPSLVLCPALREGTELYPAAE